MIFLSVVKSWLTDISKQNWCMHKPIKYDEFEPQCCSLFGKLRYSMKMCADHPKLLVLYIYKLI